MRLPRLLTGLALATLVFTACASLERFFEDTRPPSSARPATTPDYVVVNPPAPGATIRPDSEAISGADAIAPGVPRLVWVPEWRVYLREGYDSVSYDDMYYLYAHGGWYAGETDRGPWRPVSTGRTRVSSDILRAALPTPADDRIINVATRHVGSPYTWGGASPDGFDCSGFVMYVYARLGVALPHNAAQQYAHGTRVRRNELKPGDLVFFDRLRHNGIYIGDGQFVHASQRGGGVRISRLDESWFRERWTGARRVLPDEGP